MSDTNMPVTEATRERTAYELAYHVLPTVAEGEVAAVTTAIKALITKAGGEIFDEEAAAHFELAYEIEKYLEGRYRHFGTAYFGWIRFELDSLALPELTKEIESHKSLLRTLTVRLTKAEEANPFRFHEAVADLKGRGLPLTDDEVVESDEIIEVVADADDEVVAEVVK